MTSAFNGVSSTYQTMTLGYVVRAAQRRAILHQLHLTSMAYRNPSAMDGDPTQMHSPRKCQCAQFSVFPFPFSFARLDAAVLCTGRQASNSLRRGYRSGARQSN